MRGGDFVQRIVVGRRDDLEERDMLGGEPRCMPD